MPRLQDATTPLVFKVDSAGAAGATGTDDLAGRLSFRLEGRSLEGMQKGSDRHPAHAARTRLANGVG